MERKAKFIGKHREKGENYVVLFYKYRGYEYDVVVYDFENAESQKSQHIRHQYDIDCRIERESHVSPPQKVSTQQALDNLFDYFSDKITEDEFYATFD